MQNDVSELDVIPNALKVTISLSLPHCWPNIREGTEQRNLFCVYGYYPMVCTNMVQYP